MFGTSSSFRPTSLFNATPAATNQVSATTAVATNHNPMKDVEVTHPPDDTVQCLKFSPPSLATNFLVSGSWDNLVRIWEIKPDGATEPKAQQTMQGPVMSVDFTEDGSKIFIAGADKTVKIWDIASNQVAQLGQHDGAVKTCHWIKAPNYSCLMTGSHDKTLRFWDPRSPGTAMATVQMPDRIYCADMVYPMAVVGLANRTIKIFKLDGQPSEVRQVESSLKFQHRCISIFKDKAVTSPVGFGLGSIEGRVAIQYVPPEMAKDNNFTFKCHRSPEPVNNYQDIYAVNDLAFHPEHNTLATVGSDGRFSFWDKDARTKLKTSEKMTQSITSCAFNKDGRIFAYSVGYDWSKGHESYNPQEKNYIFLHACHEDMKPKKK